MRSPYFYYTSKDALIPKTQAFFLEIDRYYLLLFILKNYFH